MKRRLVAVLFSAALPVLIIGCGDENRPAPSMPADQKKAIEEGMMKGMKNPPKTEAPKTDAPKSDAKDEKSKSK